MTSERPKPADEDAFNLVCDLAVAGWITTGYFVDAVVAYRAAETERNA